MELFTRKYFIRMESEIKRTEVSSLGEFGLIDHLTKGHAMVQPSTFVGIGDDAAVIDHRDQLIER